MLIGSIEFIFFPLTERCIDEVDIQLSGLCRILRIHPEHSRCVNYSDSVGDIRRMAAPEVLVRSRSCTGTHRVEMYVPDEFRQIGVPVAEKRFIPPLKQVADLVIFSVEVLGVGEVDHLHDAGDRFLRCLDEQMHMVSHQDVCIEDKSAPVFVSADAVEVFVSV